MSKIIVIIATNLQQARHISVTEGYGPTVNPIDQLLSILPADTNPHGIVYAENMKANRQVLTDLAWEDTEGSSQEEVATCVYWRNGYTYHDPDSERLVTRVSDFCIPQSLSFITHVILVELVLPWKVDEVPISQGKYARMRDKNNTTGDILLINTLEQSSQ